MSVVEITLGKICSINVLQAAPFDSLLSTVHRMRKAAVSAIVVTSNGVPKGIITEQDIVRAVASSDADLGKLKTQDVMTSPVVSLPADTLYQTAFSLMKSNNFRHIVVTSSDCALFGIATETDFVQNLGVEYLMELKYVDSVMEKQFQTIAPHSTLQTAFEVLSTNKTSSVLIGTAEQIEGIITERDVVRLIDDQIDLTTVQVKDYMSRPLHSVCSGTTLVDMRLAMRQTGVRRMLVRDYRGKPIGMITQKSLLNKLQTHYIEILRESIKHLSTELETSQKKEQRYHGFFESAPLAYQSLDQAGKLIEVNEAWRNLMGFSQDEAAGKSFAELLSAEDQDKFKNDFQQFKARGEVRGVDYQILTKDRQCLDVRFYSKMATDTDGNFLHAHCLLTNLTEKRKAEAKLRLFRKQIDQSHDAVFVIEVTTARFLDVNQAACKYLGYSRVELLDMQVMDISSAARNIDEWRQLVSLIQANAEGLIYEAIHFHKEGFEIPVELSAIYQKNDDQDVFVSIARDISERKAAEQKLQAERNFLQTVIDSVSDPIRVIDKECRVLKANKAANKYYLKEKFETQQTHCHKLSDKGCTSGSDCKTPCPLRGVLATNKSTTVIHRQQDMHGNTRIVELIASPLYEDNGDIIGIVEAIRDITDHIQIQTELHRKERSLDHLAHHDPLTQLPNRLLFTDRLDQALLKASRDNCCVGLLFIDLDRFKGINDGFGHSLGDKLLKLVSRRLQQNTRENDTVARIGGDEFTLITNSLTRSEDASVIAQHLLDQFEMPFIIDNLVLHIGLSIGISIYPDDGTSSEELLRNADSAMYKAKASGRNRYDFYTYDMTFQASERVLLENALRVAIEHHEFELHYQPQVDLISNKVIGAEVLIRWQNRNMGLIEPDRFIPLAEKIGLIHNIDLWVVDKVCSNISRWKAEGIDIPRISVNISARNFDQTNLAERIQEVMHRYQCDSDSLELEITEGVILNNPSSASHELNLLRSMGVHLAIDDFGTGYSSLSYLKKLPLNRLKIDRSFITDISGDQNGQEISKAIIALAKNLKLEVIAEGLETEAQRMFLIKEGCNQAQGFLYSNPLSEEQFLQHLQLSY